MLTPSTTTPEFAIPLANCSREGISSRHGAHQEAQKFSTSSFPPKLDGEICFPESVVTENTGAVSPFFTTGGSKECLIVKRKVANSTTRVPRRMRSVGDARIYFDSIEEL